MAETKLRVRLKAATSTPHECLDTLMASLDLSRSDHRERFGEIQRRACLRVGSACRWQAAEATETLLATAGPKTVAALPNQSDEKTSDHLEHILSLEPDAVAYVILGSQLGLTVLRKSLRADQRTGMFLNEPDVAAWKAFLHRIQTNPPSAEQADRICNDAIRIFEIFQQEADALLTMDQLSTI